MPKVVGIRFKKTPKIYYFEAGENEFSMGQGVIVETARGVEYGEVALLPSDVDDDKVVGELKPIIRIATDKDTEKYLSFESKRSEIMRIASEKIAARELPMKLVDAKYTFDGSKIILYFAAESRVDFRELVRDLAAIFKVRIELRQIGSRDVCKMIGGIGPCGRACCCCAHNLEYSRVSVKMVKNQGLAVNPPKINGLCGNLMCCLGYENDYYVEMNKIMPKTGSEVTLEDGRKGTVTELNHIKAEVTVKVPGKEDSYTFVVAPLDKTTFKAKGEKEDAT